MSRRSVVAVAAASALVTSPLVALAAESGVSSTAATVAGLAQMQVSGATDLGVAAAKAKHIAVVLTPRNTQALDALIARGQTVTAAQYDAQYAPTAQAAAAVTSWAVEHGLSAQVAPGRTLVQVSGDSTTLGRALGVTFHTFRLADGTRYEASVGQAHLSSAAVAVSSSVVGLSDLGRLDVPNHTSAARPAATVHVGASYGPQDFWNLYHAPSTATGAGQALAIITAGDTSQAQADLPKFEDHFGLPHVAFSQIQVGPAGTDTSGATEWDLDSQYSTGFAPDASQLISYNGTSLANTDILATISRWVTDNSTRQASFSAGECEVLAIASGFTTGLNPVLQRAAAQGQSLFVSTGDAGAFCPAVVAVNGVPAGIPNVEYPASSPYAVAVGGTTIYATDPTSEIAWYAGGGGISTQKAGAWQLTAQGTYLKQSGLRGVPDVALDADPESGYQLMIAGTLTPGVGGTSASAPAWQGIWARAQGAHGGGIGFAGPVLYQIPATSFRDIRIGANGLFAASPGWDYTTGKGVPDITLVVSRA